jgi:hypothetical protein
MSKATCEHAKADPGENMRYPKETPGTDLFIQDLSCPGRHRETPSYLFQQGGGQRLDSGDAGKERL